MSRRTKVVGFSLPPEINTQIEQLLKSQHKTRSEFFRELIQLYFSTAKIASSNDQETLKLETSDLAKMLQSYWLAKSSSKLQTLIVGLAIIRGDAKHILIAQRQEPDQIVPNLTWSFPGGKLNSLDFEAELKQAIKSRTNLDIKINNLITARVFPEATLSQTQVIALYFDCSLIGTTNVIATDPYRQLRWVEPLEVFKYFTSSTSDEVARFLATLQAS